MNKDRVKKLAEILQAYLAGREIEFYSSILNEWKPAFITDISSLIKNIDNYRIKPEPKYRPFKDAKECWQEMQKHQPFGWVKYADKYISISAIDSNNDYEIDFDDYTFADSTPFGVKIEE